MFVFSCIVIIHFSVVTPHLDPFYLSFVNTQIEAANDK